MNKANSNSNIINSNINLALPSPERAANSDTAPLVFPSPLAAPSGLGRHR